MERKHRREQTRKLKDSASPIIEFAEFEFAEFCSLSVRCKRERRLAGWMRRDRRIESETGLAKGGDEMRRAARTTPRRGAGSDVQMRTNAEECSRDARYCRSADAASLLHGACAFLGMFFCKDSEVVSCSCLAHPLSSRRLLLPPMCPRQLAWTACSDELQDDGNYENSQQRWQSLPPPQ